MCVDLCSYVMRLHQHISDAASVVSVVLRICASVGLRRGFSIVVLRTGTRDGPIVLSTGTSTPYRVGTTLQHSGMYLVQRSSTTYWNLHSSVHKYHASVLAKLKRSAVALSAGTRTPTAHEF